MSRHIVLCTYELYPSNRGGCGVVVDALARRLAAAGDRVTVLGDMPERELQEWQAWARQQGMDEKSIAVAHLPSLAAQPEGSSLFAAKSRQFAEGLRALFERDPFDLVEFHEYAGVAFEALRQHRRAGWFAPARLAVRIHGSLELIDREEGTAQPTSERAAMFLMERYALRAADVVLSPSEGMGRHYARLYDLLAETVRVAQPPMDLLLPKWTRAQTNGAGHDLLVFGKLQEIKGCDLVAEAASSLFLEEPRLPGRILFVGSDVPCQRHGRPTSECVKALIAPAVRERFEFRAHLDRAELPALVGRVRAGVIASRYESFCLAAHELRSLGLPLVVAGRPAFADFFHTDDAFLFDGSVAALRKALREALVDDQKVARLRELPPMGYLDPVPVYEEVLESQRRERDWAAIEMLEQEIDFLHRAHAIEAARPKLSAADQKLLDAKKTIVGTVRKSMADLRHRVFNGKRA
ncbi:MAG TPA: glycosyltransferase family 4 protein [Myxococcales bacterium]